MVSPSQEGAWKESWNDRFQTLQERFPAISANRVANALREHDGHAGYAAADLRDLDRASPKEADPDDSEWVSTLLSNPMMFRQTCKERFQKFDANHNGYLEWREICALVDDLSDFLGLQSQSERSIRTFFEATDANGDGKLSETEFPKFFEAFLRYAFFMEHRKLVGTWSFQPDSSRGGFTEFRIVQTRDWRLQFRCATGSCPGAPEELLTAVESHDITGTLELHGGWLCAELKQGSRGSDRRLYGSIRVQLAEGSGDVVTANFQRPFAADFGKSVFSRRVGDPPKTPSLHKSFKTSSSTSDRKKHLSVGLREADLRLEKQKFDDMKISEWRPNSSGNSMRAADGWRSSSEPFLLQPRGGVLHAWN